MKKNISAAPIIIIWPLHITSASVLRPTML